MGSISIIATIRDTEMLPFEPKVMIDVQYVKRLAPFLEHNLLKELGNALDEFKVNGKPIKLTRINIAARPVRMLFKQFLITLYKD
jgi:hypothetical protein